MNIQIKKPRFKRFTLFALVGIVGFLINNSILWITHDVLGWLLFLCSPIAISIAIFNNFMLNYFFTWKGNINNRKYTYLQSLWRYYATASLAGVVNYSILLSLTYLFDLYYLAANIIGILAGMMINFIFSEKWTFSNNLYQIEK